mgnify:FL=1
MLSIKEITKEDVGLCFELDSKTISLWSTKQWEEELKKKGVKVFNLSLLNEVIGICAIQLVIDEAQINYFSVNQKFRRQGFGTYLMRYLIEICEELNIKKLILEVSETNYAAKNFYNHFQFFTVGIRKKYYKDGSDALLKEKILIKK